VSTRAFAASLGAGLLLGSLALAPAPIRAARPGVDVGQAVAAPAPAGKSGKVWVGRHDEYVEYLKTARIDKVEDIGTGVTHPERAFFSPGGLARSATVKHLPPGRRSGFWESYKSEIAAYEVDRLLGMDMVPPTVERRVGDALASVQLWIDGCRLVNTVDQSACPSPNYWAKQAWRQRAFDNLIANIDRNEGNLLVDGQWDLILIDHSRAFAENTMPFVKQLERIDRPFFERLKALDQASLMKSVRPWVVNDGAIRDLLKRRDRIVAHLEELARQRGEAIVFPVVPDTP
jgi:hypothetical protein